MSLYVISSLMLLKYWKHWACTTGFYSYFLGFSFIHLFIWSLKKNTGCKRYLLCKSVWRVVFLKIDHSIFLVPILPVALWNACIRSWGFSHFHWNWKLLRSLWLTQWIKFSRSYVLLAVQDEVTKGKRTFLSFHGLWNPESPCKIPGYPNTATLRREHSDTYREDWGAPGFAAPRCSSLQVWNHLQNQILHSSYM